MTRTRTGSRCARSLIAPVSGRILWIRSGCPAIPFRDRAPSCALACGQSLCGVAQSHSGIALLGKARSGYFYLEGFDPRAPAGLTLGTIHTRRRENI